MNPYSLRSLENDAICAKILLSTLTMKLSMKMFGNILTVGIVVITRSAGDLSKTLSISLNLICIQKSLSVTKSSTIKSLI